MPKNRSVIMMARRCAVASSIPAAVLVQSVDELAERAVLAITLDTARAHRTEPPGGRRLPAGPDGSFTIFKQRPDTLASEVRIVRELASLPTRESFRGADPEGPIA